MTKRVLYIVLAIVGIGFIGGLYLLFGTGSQYTTLSRGIDSYNTHRLLFGSNTFSQEIVSSKPIRGIGIIAVNIRQANQVASITIDLLDSNDGLLASGTINPEDIADDTFAFALLPEPITLPSQKGRVRLQAPTATLENPAGIRFDPADSPLSRFENDRLQAGIFAVRLKEQVSAGQALYSWFNRYNEEVATIVTIAAIFIVSTVLALEIGWKSFSKQIKQRIRFSVVVVIALAALVTHITTEKHMGGVSGGDPYNYLEISETISQGNNPFAGVKRLPGYPIILLPAVLEKSIDAHTYMRFVSSIAASIAIILTFLLAQQLKLSWPVSFSAVLLLAWQKDFFATSLRPEPYTVFTALLLGAIVLFFSKRKLWQQLLFGFCLGYAAMTRQEGFLLAIILFSAECIRLAAIFLNSNQTFPWRNHILSLLRMFGVALLVVLPFFTHNLVSYGNPLYTPYFEGEKLQIVDSWQAFSDATTSTWSIITSMWKPSWTQLELLMPYDHALVPLMVFALIAWWVFGRYGPRKRWVLLPLALIGVGVVLFAFWLAITDTKDAARLMPIAIAGILIPAPFLFTAQTRWRGLLVVAVLISQLLIATWFHPFPKHYQQSYPLIALLVATSIFSAVTTRNRITAIPLYAGWLTPFAISSFLLFSHLSIFVDAHNASAALDSVIYRAARAASLSPKPYAYTQDNLPARFYHITDDLLFTTNDGWQDRAKTLVIIDDDSSEFTVPPGWREVASFKSEGKDEVLYRSFVYTADAAQ